MLRGVSDLAPGFLIAVPQLADPNFHRSVVLMLEHTAEGALGLVVNRPAEATLGDVLRTQGLRPSVEAALAPVFIGGPVQPERGFVLHDRPDLPESVALFDGLYVSASMETLTTLAEGPMAHFRLILGYAGWSAGQLEKELRDGSWISTEASSRHVLETPPAQAWDQVLRGMGIDPMMLLMGKGNVH